MTVLVPDWSTLSHVACCLDTAKCAHLPLHLFAVGAAVSKCFDWCLVASRITRKVVGRFLKINFGNA